MEVRITFRSEVYLKGDSLEEIKEKWANLNLYSDDAWKNANVSFVEVCSAEDADTYEEVNLADIY